VVISASRLEDYNTSHADANQRLARPSMLVEAPWLSGCGNSLPPQDAAIGNPENPRRFRVLPKWKKAMDGFFHGQLSIKICEDSSGKSYTFGKLLLRIFEM